MTNFKASWGADITASDELEAAQVVRDLLEGGLRVVNLQRADGKRFQVRMSPGDMVVVEVPGARP